MGVSYSATPVNEFAKQADTAWLKAIGIELPIPIPPGRRPTAREIRGVLETSPNLRVGYQVEEWRWTADVTSTANTDDQTFVSLSDFEGDEDQPLRVVFDKGSEQLIIQIAKGLSQLCGPLILDNDVDGAPLLVNPDTEIVTAQKGWWIVSQKIAYLSANRKIGM